MTRLQARDAAGSGSGGGGRRLLYGIADEEAIAKGDMHFWSAAAVRPHRLVIYPNCKVLNILRAVRQGAALRN